MLYLKTCPKCRGDLYRENDMYGDYTACCQCGCVLNQAQEQDLNKLLEKRVAKLRSIEETATA